MEQIIELLKTNWYIPLIFAAGILYMIFMNVFRKKKTKDYSKNHPNAVRVFLGIKGGITSDIIQVITVDGALPDTFVSGTKTGVFLLPGTHELELEHSHSRPGVMHKTVTTSTGMVKRRFAVEEGKAYTLSFDREEHEFVIEELD